MCLQYYDHGWDSYSPDGIQSQCGYGLNDLEANCFGKKEKGLTHDEPKGILHDAFNTADPSSMH